MQPLYVNKDYCTRVIGAKSKCTRCLDICPCNSIEITSDKIKILENCNGCGLCLSVCNNDVFTLKNFGENSAFKWFDQNRKKERVDIYCERAEKTTGLITPCIYSLTENILIYPFIRGVKQLLLHLPECKLCENQKGKSNIVDKVELSKKLLAFLNLDGEIKFNESDRKPSQNSKKDLLSRRYFLKYVTEKPIARVIGENKKKEMNDRRKNLLQIISKNKIMDYADVRVDSKDSPFCAIQINKTCNGCIVCERLCPVGAITRIENEKSITIQFSPQRCTNCRLCVDSCFFSSISVDEEVGLKRIVKNEHLELTSIAD